MAQISNIIFATGNKGKVAEMTKLAANTELSVISPLDLVSIYGSLPDVEETGSTYYENALLKANAFYAWSNSTAVFADDSGLEVDALDGKPGLYTARYAGLQATDKDNRALMLKNLAGVVGRTARFRCVLVAVLNAQDIITAEGVVDGRITDAEFGDGGFGYDPIFIPDGESKTIAQLKSEGVIVDTHRARAFRNLVKLML